MMIKQISVKILFKPFCVITLYNEKMNLCLAFCMRF